MSALKQYANAIVAIEGGILLEAESVSVNRDPSAQEIATMALGFAGISPGAAKLTASVKNAVPMAGIEFNADKYWSTTGVPKVVEFTLFMGSAAVLTSKGFIMKDSLEGSASSPSGYSFEFLGQYAPVG